MIAFLIILTVLNTVAIAALFCLMQAIAKHTANTLEYHNKMFKDIIYDTKRNK
jgi:hypothetical protein